MKIVIMKKTFLTLSVFFNILIIGGSIYLLLSSSFSANIESDNSTELSKNYDSINKINKVKLTEISPDEFHKKIEKLSKNKTSVVIFWASWCRYCPELITIINKIKSDNEYDFNLIMVSIDKPNDHGKKAVLKKIGYLDLKGEQFITNTNDYLDISNSKVIYKYLIDKTEFDKNPGFPHIQIVQDNKIVYEDSGYDNVYGLSKYIDYLKK
jgi:thiol-disulfide isomerase/thioredoxin